MIELGRAIVRYHELIWVLALKELKIRYKRSLLGFLWALLHPLLLMIILTIVFSTLLRFPIEKYAVFLISALFPWIFFSQALAYCVDSMIANGSLLKVIAIPKAIFPTAAIIANLINFLLSLIPLALLLLVLGFPLHWTWLYLPVPLLALVAFTLGCGLFCAAANVFFRDVSHIVQIVLTGLFYFSPILYSLQFIPERYHILFRLNPLLYILNGFRLAIYYGTLPSLASAVMSVGCGLLTLIIGFSVFRRFQDSFVFYV